jgi:hypothetical protein
VVTPDHLDAAMALWEYAERSCQHIFGDALGDPVADDILRALRRAGDEGLSRTQIRELFGGHKRSQRIDGALALLHALGLAVMARRETGGRPVEVWTARRGFRAYSACRATSGETPTPRLLAFRAYRAV